MFALSLSLIASPQKIGRNGLIANMWIVLKTCLFVFICLCVCTLELLPNEDVDRLNDVKFLVQQLYTTLRIEEHQLSKERELLGQLEDLNSQLRPLEKVLMLLQIFFVVG